MSADCAIYGDATCDCVWTCRADWDGVDDSRADRMRAGLDPDPPRCWSCGHPYDALCECSCCADDDPHGEWNPDA